MSESQDTNLWYLERLPADGVKEIVEHYAKVWTAKEESGSLADWISLEEEIDLNDSGGEVDFRDDGIRRRCKKILETLERKGLAGLEEACITRGMARAIEKHLAVKWAKLVGSHIDGSGKSVNNLDKAVKRRSASNSPKKNCYFLKEIKEDGRTRKECLEVLKSQGLCEPGDSEIPSSIAPFGNLCGDESGWLSWRRYGNTMKHIGDDLDDHFENRKDKQNELTVFFDNPAIGKFDDRQLEDEIKKVIDFITPGTGDFLLPLVQEAWGVMKTEAHTANFLERRMGIVLWKKWVNPYSSGKSPFMQLCQKIYQFPVVEIWGNGGLGKTHLAQHFTRENIKGNTIYDKSRNHGEKRFERIIWMPTKKVKEWGAWRVGTGDPRDPRTTWGVWNENATYNFFLGQILLHEAEKDWTKGDTERALHVFRNVRMLIVLDNFEDICRDPKELERFIKFFDSIGNSRDCEGRIIITGRDENVRGVGPAADLYLRQFDRMQIPELLSKAFLEKVESQKKGDKDFKYSPNAVKFLSRDSPHITGFIDKVAENVSGHLVNQLGKPYNILEYVSIIGEESYKLRSENLNADEFGEKVMQVAAESQKLHAFIQKSRAKSAEDAYTRLIRDSRCKELLIILGHSRKAMNEEKIRVESLKGSIALSSDDVEDALRKISIYEDLIDDRADEGESRTGKAYVLSHFSMDILGELLNEDWKSTEAKNAGLVPSTREMLIALKGSIQRCNEEGGVANFSQPSTNLKGGSSGSENIASMGVGTAIQHLKEAEEDPHLGKRLELNNDNLVKICKFIGEPYSGKSKGELKRTIIDKSDKIPINCVNLSLSLDCLKNLNHEINVSEIDEVVKWFTKWTRRQVEELLGDLGRAEDGEISRIAELTIMMIDVFPEMEQNEIAKEILTEHIDFLIEHIESPTISDEIWPDKLAKLISSEGMLPGGG